MNLRVHFTAGKHNARLRLNGNYVSIPNLFAQFAAASCT